MHDRNRLSFGALCSMARRVFAQEPSLDDAEWKERIKCRIAQERRPYPTPIELAAALSAVEAVCAKQGARRLALETSPPPAAVRDHRPLSGDEARAALTELAARLGPLPALTPRTMPSGASELMNTRERYAVVAAIEKLRTIVRLRKANRGITSA
jgi:hypothetical protein